MPLNDIAVLIGVSIIVSLLIYWWLFVAPIMLLLFIAKKVFEIFDKKDIFTTFSDKVFEFIAPAYEIRFGIIYSIFFLLTFFYFLYS